jgi:hypothetical protein
LAGGAGGAAAAGGAGGAGGAGAAGFGDGVVVLLDSTISAVAPP